MFYTPDFRREFSDAIRMSRQSSRCEVVGDVFYIVHDI